MKYSVIDQLIQVNVGNFGTETSILSMNTHHQENISRITRILFVLKSRFRWNPRKSRAMSSKILRPC